MGQRHPSRRVSGMVCPYETVASWIVHFMPTSTDHCGYNVDWTRMEFVLKEEPSGLGDWQSGRISNSVGSFSNLTEKKELLVWQNDTKGQFSVNSVYKKLNKNAGQEMEWPWKIIWKPKVPYRVNYFMWLLTKEAVLTHENLKQRGY